MLARFTLLFTFADDGNKKNWVGMKHVWWLELRRGKEEWVGNG
jgi:hypothetical protein